MKTSECIYSKNPDVKDVLKMANEKRRGCTSDGERKG